MQLKKFALSVFAYVGLLSVFWIPVVVTIVSVSMHLPQDKQNLLVLAGVAIGLCTGFYTAKAITPPQKA